MVATNAWLGNSILTTSKWAEKNARATGGSPLNICRRVRRGPGYVTTKDHRPRDSRHNKLGPTTWNRLAPAWET